jgi:hypothetical protein
VEVPPQEVLSMNMVIETSVERRKEWVTPELKKVDIEQITATGLNPGADTDGNS